MVDVTRLNIGDHITAGQVKLPQGVTLASDPELMVISVLAPRMTEAEADAEDQAAQVAGLVAAGELTEEAAEAVLEGETSIEEAKAEVAGESSESAEEDKTEEN